VIVSHDDRRPLGDAVRSLYRHAGDVRLEVLVVDNGSDGAADLVEREFPAARTLRCENRGFGHANNRALEQVEARYVLFVNPDAEVVGGSLGELVATLDGRPGVGLAGVRQLRRDGTLAPSIRRFPSPVNALAEAFGVEKLPGVRRRLGERELDPGQYARLRSCDWTSGSFMLVRSAALPPGDWFDEGFFLYSEETDLCWRLRERGWEVIHAPCVTVLHDESERSRGELMEAQSAYSRLRFARKNLARWVALYRWALGLRYALRVLLYPLTRRGDAAACRAARAALMTVVSGRAPLRPRS
jgi:GT2 family glycosyltransferase